LRNFGLLRIELLCNDWTKRLGAFLRKRSVHT
jgi:hypothetical protein